MKLKDDLQIDFLRFLCFRVSGAMVARGTPNAEAPGSSPGWRSIYFCILHSITLLIFFSVAIQ